MIFLSIILGLLVAFSCSFYFSLHRLQKSNEYGNSQMQFKDMTNGIIIVIKENDVKPAGMISIINGQRLKQSINKNSKEIKSKTK